jgi:hypothetical protein
MKRLCLLGLAILLGGCDGEDRASGPVPNPKAVNPPLEADKPEGSVGIGVPSDQQKKAFYTCVNHNPPHTVSQENMKDPKYQGCRWKFTKFQ